MKKSILSIAILTATISAPIMADSLIRSIDEVKTNISVSNELIEQGIEPTTTDPVFEAGISAKVYHVDFDARIRNFEVDMGSNEISDSQLRTSLGYGTDINNIDLHGKVTQHTHFGSSDADDLDFTEFGISAKYAHITADVTYADDLYGQDTQRLTYGLTSHHDLGRGMLDVGVTRVELDNDMGGTDYHYYKVGYTTPVTRKVDLSVDVLKTVSKVDAYDESRVVGTIAYNF